MTAIDYAACESRLLVHEGSRYTDGVHPYDPGGPTRWGITLADARMHWKHDATAEDVRTMPKQVAMDIYRPRYWGALHCDELPAGVDDTVFDYGVNSGISRSGKVLRRVLGLPDADWHVTPAVLDAVAKRSAPAIINAINDERIRFLQGLRIWPTYRGGWTTRVREVRAYDLQLAAAKMPVSIPAITPASERAKGAVAPPNVAKTIAVGGAGGGVIGGTTLWGLLAAHPYEAGAIAIVGGGVIIGGVYYATQAWHRATFDRRQDAPTPGITVVPPQLVATP